MSFLPSSQRYTSVWPRIDTLDMHTAGEPVRIIVSGLPVPKGRHVLQRRETLRKKYDHIRQALMCEPRGHANMYGCVLVPPNDSSACFGVIFMHTEGYSSMCGHATIALTRWAYEEGWTERLTPFLHQIVIDTPCGRIRSYVQLKKKQLKAIYLNNVASFVVKDSLAIQVPDLGQVICAIAYGGAFYAYVNAEDYSISLSADNHTQLTQLGRAIKDAVCKQAPQTYQHPHQKDLSFLYGTIFVGPAESNNVHSRHVCVFGNGQIDRSPTGSGISGFLALLHARNEIQIGASLQIESIIGTYFTGSVQKETTFGPFERAIVPRIEGMAYFTAQSTFFLEPDDPLKKGFILG